MKNKEKISWLILAAVEAYHLVKHNGSITERLYGFQRSTSDKSALNWIQIILSIVELIGIPYLKSVLEKYEGIPQEKRDALKKALLAHDMINLACRLAYIYNRTNSYSLLMFLGRMQYTRSGKSQSLMPFESWIGTSLFLIRFVDWWKTQSGLDQPVTYAALVPPAPKPSRDQIGHLRGSCGICLGEIVEPVSTPSGIVYCSRCLSTYRLLHAGQCPLTNAVLLDSDITPIFLE